MQLLRFSVELAWIQVKAGRKFLFEHPHAASSWDTECLRELASYPGVYYVRVDLCQFGLILSPDGVSKKPT
eukprot:8855143-Pyramimonas_sp.AAC.1